MIYVLDTNVIIHYLKRDVNITANFRRVITEGHTLLLPRAVDYEICRGLEILFATKKAAIYKEITGSSGLCKIVDMGEYVWELAKRIYVDLYQNDYMVGEIDILIGAFCLHHGYTLITSNIKDFQRINGLELESWWM